MNKHSRYIFPLLMALVAFGCGDDAPPPVELCSPPPPEDCTIDVEAIPAYDGRGTIIIEDARDLEPFCEQSCNRLDTILEFRIREGTRPKTLSPLSNIVEMLGLGVGYDRYHAPDFRGLENLRRMRFLQIASESSIRSLDGLNGLEEIGVIELELLPNLESLEGLSGLQRIDDEAFYDDTAGLFSKLRRLDRIESFAGLESLTEINGTIKVQVNPSLKNFEGLENLEVAGEVFIEDNENLRSLDGLDGLQEANQLVFIRNSNLPTCEIEDFTESVNVLGNPRAQPEWWIWLEDNSPECPQN